MPGKYDFVHYGAYGVCQVEDIRPIRFGPDTPRREYYVLKPISQDGASIFVPADNLKLMSRMRPVLSEEEIDRRVREAAAFVGLSDAMLEQSPFELSGGQKRRVAIAGVIAMEPSVLILDEPTAGLDPVGVESILANIHDYHVAKNATIIIVSHSMEEVARTVDRLVVVNDGRIPFAGTPREVFAHEEELIAMGLGVPQVTRVLHQLRKLGVDVDDTAYTMEQAKAAVMAAYRARKGAV